MKRSFSRYPFLARFLGMAMLFCCVTASAQATDTDGDGLNDDWEITYFGNTDVSASADNDGDGVANWGECQAGLNPLLADTDEDGQNDSIGVPGFLSSEQWEGIPNGVSTLAGAFASEAFLKEKPLKSFVSHTELPQNSGANYLVRWRGTLIAPLSGSYRFFAAADDQCELWLGDAGGSKFTRRKIATVYSFTSARQWTASPSQNSGLIDLVAGESYHFEIVMYESGGPDHLSVGWIRPGSTAVEIIPGKLADGTVVLKGDVPDPEDLDDDGLPDSWELTVGLNGRPRLDQPSRRWIFRLGSGRSHQLRRMAYRWESLREKHDAGSICLCRARGAWLCGRSPIAGESV